MNVSQALAAAWQRSGTSSEQHSHVRIADVDARLHDLGELAAINTSGLARWFGEADHGEYILQRATPAAWCNVRRHDVLRISVIGTSVTAGCGIAPDGLCWPRMGWARQFADLFDSVIATTALKPAWRKKRREISIWPKNAAPLRFWLQCTQSSFKLSHNTSIVIIETEPTLSPADEDTLLALLTNVRACAPNAVICFIQWPSQWQLSSNRAAERMVRKLSLRKQFDVASASVLLDATERGGDAAKRFYGDAVHPTAQGHALLAGLACAWLVQGLLALETTERPHCRLSGGEHGTREHDSPDSSALAYESCYARADAIPVVEPLAKGWRLVDEGGAKRVVKMGYLSNRTGDTLRVGPILPDVQCGVFDVSLGFLASWRTNQLCYVTV